MALLYLEITKVTIVTGRGADKVFLHTTELSPCPGITQESLGLDFDVEIGKGFHYVTKVLRIDDELIEVIKG